MATTECCERGAALWNFINLQNQSRTAPETRPPRRLLLVRSLDSTPVRHKRRLDEGWPVETTVGSVDANPDA